MTFSPVVSQRLFLAGPRTVPSPRESATPTDGAGGEVPRDNLTLANLSLQVTAAFSFLATATFALAGSLDLIYAVVSAILFFLGTGVLGLGFWNGIQRSKLETVRLTGLVAVDKSHVSVAARNKLWLAIIIQIAVSFTFASLRPFTQQAFGVLVPTLGLGFAALYGSRFAQFHPREDR